MARFAAAQGISVGRAQRLLENELSYTLHKPRRQRFPTLKVQAEGIDHQWVADLVEMQRLARYNRGVRYLFTVVDVLSKYAWVQPLKAKTGVAMVKAFETILKGRRKPIQLQTDRGKEFYNRPFQSFLKQHNIHHFSTEGDAKASNVERFNRTLKGRMFRYFTAANTLRFDKVLPSLVQGYNASYHRSIGMAPQDVTRRNERAVWRRLFGGPKMGKEKTSSFPSGRSCSFEQETSHVPEKLLAGVDRRSVCGATGAARTGAYLQDSRMGSNARVRDVLRARPAKSASGERRSLPH